jgi:hypothetical protein
MRSFRRPKQPPIFARTLPAPAGSSGGAAAGGGSGMWRAPLVAFSATVLLVIVLASVELLGGGGGSSSGGAAGRRYALPPAAPAPPALASGGGVPPPFTPDSPELEGGRIDFCPGLARPPPPDGGREEGGPAAAAVRAQARSTFNLVNPAPSGQSACAHWTSLRYPTLLPAPIPLCVHDPAVDGGVSAHIVANGGFMTRVQLSLLLAAAPCTPSQPYFIDAGANVGSWGMLAAVAAGCHVLAFEPLAANVAALVASAAANNVSHRFTVFRNALGGAPGRAAIEVSWGNSGANRLAAWGNLPPEAEGGGERDDFFLALLDYQRRDRRFGRVSTS